MTDDLAEKVEAMRVDVDWSEERAARVEKRMRMRGRRRTMMRRGLAVGVTALAAFLIFVSVRRFSSAPARAVAVLPGAPSASALAAPRVIAIPLTPDARVVEKDGSFTLGAGSARFDAAHVGTEVHCASVTVTARDAIFTIEDQNDERVIVRVESGRVLVAWALGAQWIEAGGEFAAPPTLIPPTASHLPSAPAKPWRSLAQAGDYEDAYRALAQSGGASSVRDEPQDLMLAADVARLSKHPSEAVAPLTTVIHKHATDPRAPLAAFTLGRVELEDLGHPREAADAFATVRTLAPDGPLAEDALAREVESRARAGDTSKAHELALAYVAKYPQGRRERSVRTFGGLE